MNDLPSKIEAAHRLLVRVAGEFAPAVLASSLGAEDMVLTDLIFANGLAVDVFTLDTGRLPPETYTLIDRIAERYGRRVRVIFPRAEAVERYVASHGVNGFYKSVERRKACCEVRKVEPLARALAGKRAWITGLRRGQSVTRSAVAMEAFDAERGLMKFSPLAGWEERDVWNYLRAREVPYHALHDRGYPSVGCAPCTRAVTTGEDQRAGRWWWESADSRECGLHVQVDGRIARAEVKA